MAELRAACFRRNTDRDGWPSVSVVVPVRNESPYLEHAVTSIMAQNYPEPFDVCLAVAPSDDDTFDIARRLSIVHDRVSMVANPVGVTPAGLNTAIAATTGSIVVRVDGHAELSSGYIRRAVETMVATGAVNVGGMQVPKPESPFEAAVAAATTSWLGTGGASYRVGGEAGPVDTVFLGVFDRVAGDAVGWFDERLIRNQDYELNIRLRAAGGAVWFDPDLSVAYRPRSSWPALVKQYADYGYWKSVVIRLHPESLQPRQLIPMVATIGLTTSTLLGFARARFLLAPIAYGTLVIRFSRPIARRSAVSVTAVAAVVTTMHLSWGVGALRGFLHAGYRFGRERCARTTIEH